MKFTKWLFIIVCMGLSANIVFLYILLFQIKTDLQNTFTSQITSLKHEISQIQPATPPGDMQDSVASISATTSCSQPCMNAINDIKKSIKESTPITSTTVFSPVSGSSNAEAKEFTIQLGAGKTSSVDWEDVAGLNAYIDSTNYQRIKSVTFEAAMHIPTANGQMTARLFNKTDGHPVWNSEVSTTSDVSVLKQSSGIMLDSGNKLYQVQLKTSLKYESLLDGSRIKIILQ